MSEAILPHSHGPAGNDDAGHAPGAHGTMGTLVTGLGLAGFLTLVPFIAVSFAPGLGATGKIAVIMVAGAAQILVHLVYFLHLRRETESGWTLSASVFAAVILAIVLAGSLWVMHNMTENMMPMDMGAMGSEAAPMAMPMDHAGHGG